MADVELFQRIADFGGRRRRRPVRGAARRRRERLGGRLGRRLQGQRLRPLRAWALAALLLFNTTDMRPITRILATTYPHADEYIVSFARTISQARYLNFTCTSLKFPENNFEFLVFKNSHDFIKETLQFSEQKSIPPMKNRSGTNACLENRSNERVYLKKKTINCYSYTMQLIVFRNVLFHLVNF